MKRLTENEINFIKSTGWTPTLHQMNYSKTEMERVEKNYPIAFKMPDDGNMEKCYRNIATLYEVDIDELYNKTCNIEKSDGISLEYEATYLLYTFFTKEELEKLTDEEATKWLKDFKYYCGYRKWDGGNLVYVNEATEIYAGTREFFDMDGDVWNRKIES